VDLHGGSNLFSVPCRVPIQNPAPWSADDRFVAFATATNLIAADSNATNDVYLCDTLSGALTLVSLSCSGDASGNGPSDWPSISADGRFVVYRSFATNISSLTNRPPSLFVFDRFTGSNSILPTATSSPEWTSWILKPVVSGAGKTVVFQAWSAGLASGDINRSQDVFAAEFLPWGLTDTDADGIPDSWTLHFFGHPTGEPGDLSRADDDADGDGLNNLEEFLASTNPFNPGSVLRLEIAATVSPTGKVTLQWTRVPGQTYRVQANDDLGNPGGWHDVPGALRVVGTKASWTSAVDELHRFYRAVVEN
jgi:hypothetical protein